MLRCDSECWLGCHPCLALDCKFTLQLSCLHQIANYNSNIIVPIWDMCSNCLDWDMVSQIGREIILQQVKSWVWRCVHQGGSSTRDHPKNSFLYCRHLNLLHVLFQRWVMKCFEVMDKKMALSLGFCSSLMCASSTSSTPSGTISSDSSFMPSSSWSIFLLCPSLYTPVKKTQTLVCPPPHSYCQKEK